MQFMLGYCFYHPSDYGRFIIVIVEVAQVVRVQRADAAYNLSERITFDSVDFAILMPPKSFYRIHDTYPPNLRLSSAFRFTCYGYIQYVHYPIALFAFTFNPENMVMVVQRGL